MGSKWVLGAALAVLLLRFSPLARAQWAPLGPDGGDARSLAYDPNNPDHVLLGTSTGELFESLNGGRKWSRLAHLGAGSDYVLDNIAFDSDDSNVVYAAAWSVENPERGDLFKSLNGGGAWRMLERMQGKSIRALALAPSNPKVIVAGALDGVFRSEDGGNSWRQISPPGHAEIKNIESLAIDPANPDVIYAGTWHLPWKTEDGGHNWYSIRQGVVDDSDVFSIIIDPRNPATLFLSACTGIYRSDDAGALFRKVQGIPESARRTRVLQEDPISSKVVFAGTTEGLWRTSDGGESWTRLTDANVIVNDVMVDPRNRSRVLIATDRGGVLASDDGGLFFRASNAGFTHRQVTSLVADSKGDGVLYAGVINDKEFGGVFVSADRGSSWRQVSVGLGGRDVFSLEQDSSGTLLAGTNDGVFVLRQGEQLWRASSTLLRRQVVQSSGSAPQMPASGLGENWVAEQFAGRISQVRVVRSGNDQERWFAAGAEGVFRSLDQGNSWTGGPLQGEAGFVVLDARDKMILAANTDHGFLSLDGGENWDDLSLPPHITPLTGLTLTPNAIWVASRLGIFRSRDRGKSWAHVTAGDADIARVSFDPAKDCLFAIAASRQRLFQSLDGGDSWTLVTDFHRPMRGVSRVGDRLFAITEFDGIYLQSPSSSPPPAAKTNPKRPQ